MWGGWLTRRAEKGSDGAGYMICGVNVIATNERKIRLPRFVDPQLDYGFNYRFATTANYHRHTTGHPE